MSEFLIPLLHLTPAIRAFLINQLVSDQDAPELALVLLEPEVDREPPAEIRRRLKAKLNALAQPQGAESSLVQACEHIVQFALLRPTAVNELAPVNALLPEGLQFSHQSGRLLIDLALYRQGAIGQEDTHVYNYIAHTPLNPAHTPQPPQTEPDTALSQPQTPTPEISKQTPDPQAQEALKTLQGIRQRRMELLKKVRSEMHG